MMFQIAVYGMKVVGIKFCGGTDSIKINEPCILERDISNPHDVNAIPVLHRETNSVEEQTVSQSMNHVYWSGISVTPMMSMQ